MCGIHGGWTPQPLPDPALEASLTAITHRGPDDSGIHRDGQAFIGMRRLSIIDLAGGHQPIFNESGDVAVVFNGEIYNYKELIPPLKRAGHLFTTESDTEVLVHLWEEHGTRMCDTLRGMFAFAIWDARQQLMFVARDRFGKKPLYLTQTADGGLLFASELKALRPLAIAAQQPWTIRPQSLYDYASMTVIPQPNTIYNEVSMLPAGHWMLWNGASLRQQRYWSLSIGPKTTLSYADAQARVRHLIAESVRLRLRSDVPLGVFLSGGVDSTVIAYEAAQLLGGSLQAFTVSTDDPTLDESAIARRTATALGIQQTMLPLKVSPLAELERLVRHYDQPYADSSAIPSMALSRLARQHVKVVLNGDGGDELFGGYRRYVAAVWLGHLQKLPASLLRATLALVDRLRPPRRSTLGLIRRMLHGALQRPGTRYLSWTLDMLFEADKQALWIGPPNMRPTEELIEATLPQQASTLDTQLGGDQRLILLSDLLVKMDMATMAASLEARSPLMDHELAEFTATLPDHYRVRRNTPKAILRDAYRHLVPTEVTQAPKRGFEIPMNRWLETDLKPILMDTVGAHDARVRDWFSRHLIDGLLAGNLFQERNRTYLLYALLVLELWLRQEESAPVP
ncbi:MAG: asparagine synthase (glutamine-hydrolyzing) [Myxococcota bacterium]